MCTIQFWSWMLIGQIQFTSIVESIYCILKTCYKVLFTYLLQYIDLYFCCVVIVVISGKNFVIIDQPPILPAPTLAPEGKEVELKGMVYSMSMRRVEKYIKNI